ncbi:MAG: hypothetical protein Q8K18_11520 [Burkholderiales bacterium]|nr:hypothetical protein [Burkholderiales bacterium]
MTMSPLPASVAHKPLFLLTMWILVSSAANLAWEFAQLPLYTLYADPDAGKIVRYVLHCTAGDVLIALGAYALTALALGNWSWPLRNPLRGIVLATTLGLTYTAASEWYNVYLAPAWAYSERMPLVFGIGLAPLLQWLLIPPLVLFIVRRTSAPTAPNKQVIKSGEDAAPETVKGGK